MSALGLEGITVTISAGDVFPVLAFPQFPFFDDTGSRDCGEVCSEMRNPAGQMPARPGPDNGGFRTRAGLVNPGVI